MFGFRKSPLTKVTKQNSVDPGTNPFDSDTESDFKTIKPARRTSSEPALITPNKSDLFDDDEGRGNYSCSSSSSSSYSVTPQQRSKYKNDFRDSGGLEKQSVQELESYAVYKSEETTNSVNNCLKIAENIKEDATNTLVTLHKQGEQITRTHMVVADSDQDLSRGEKLLGGLGGMFSKTWKPKKTRAISGPVTPGNDELKKKTSHLRQREKLGLAPIPKGHANNKQTVSEPTNAIQKVELEKTKQDDALSDLSNILGDLKGMAVEMGSELERQNDALDNLGEDVDELNHRMKGANQRARRLVGK